jgi:hypothetical protein
MSTSDAILPRGFRGARECALALLAGWLVLENLGLALMVVARGGIHSWWPLAVLGAATLALAPLWLLPLALCVRELRARARNGRTS